MNNNDCILYKVKTTKLIDMNNLKKRIKFFARQCVKLALALPKNDLANNIRSQISFIYQSKLIIIQ